MNDMFVCIFSEAKGKNREVEESKGQSAFLTKQCFVLAERDFRSRKTNTIQ